MVCVYLFVATQHLDQVSLPSYTLYLSNFFPLALVVFKELLQQIQIPHIVYFCFPVAKHEADNCLQLCTFCTNNYVHSMGLKFSWI